MSRMFPGSAWRSPPLRSLQLEHPSAVARQLLHNGVALFLAYALPRLFTMGAVVVAARALRVEDFGAFGTAAAFAVIMSILATLGMVPLLVREIAAAPKQASRLLRSAHVVKTGANLVMLATLLVVGRVLLGYGTSVLTAALLLGGGYAVGAYAENLAAYFQSVERMQVWAQASALFGLVSGGLGALLVVSTHSLTWFCTAPLVGQAAALAWLFRSLPAEVRRGAPADLRFLKQLLREMLPFAAGFLALTLYSKTDVLLLARWRSTIEVGFYTAAYKFVDLTQALCLVCAGAVYPRLTRALGRVPAGRAADRLPHPPPPTDLAGRPRRGRPGRMIGRLWRNGPASAGRAPLAAAAVVVAGPAILWLARAPIVTLLYGARYRESAHVLAFLAPVLPALAVNIMGGYVLSAARRMGRVAALYGMALALDLVLNVVLIPTHGPTGAAAARLVAELTLAAGMLATLATIGATPASRPAEVRS